MVRLRTSSGRILDDGRLGRVNWNTVTVSGVILLTLPILSSGQPITSWERAMKCPEHGRERQAGAGKLHGAGILITASIICFTGTIGFIGLVAPHITRMVIGVDHRFLLPASGIVGALLLLGADTVSRTILAPQIIPVGITTAFLGVPFFIFLFYRRDQQW